jgi:hypothetical protein
MQSGADCITTRKSWVKTVRFSAGPRIPFLPMPMRVTVWPDIKFLKDAYVSY